jgi:hypothetical protein
MFHFVKREAQIRQVPHVSILRRGKRASTTLRKAGCDQAQGFLFGRPLSTAAANSLANADLSASNKSSLSSWQQAS